MFFFNPSLKEIFDLGKIQNLFCIDITGISVEFYVLTVCKERKCYKSLLQLTPLYIFEKFLIIGYLRYLPFSVETAVVQIFCVHGQEILWVIIFMKVCNQDMNLQIIWHIESIWITLFINLVFNQVYHIELKIQSS